MKLFGKKELFAGSSVVRRFTYKTNRAGVKCALFEYADCFVCSLPM